MSQIKQKCQTAFAAWLESKLASTPKLSDAYVAAALTGDDYALPAVVVRAIKSEELVPGCNVHEVDLVFAIASSLDDDLATGQEDQKAGRHQERVRAVHDLLFDVTNEDPVARIAAVITELNKPSVGDDERVIKDFTCSGYIISNEEDGRTLRHVEDSITLKVTCSWGDPA